MKTTGTVYWVTGLSGAGKTTLATALVEKLKTTGKSPIFLDGDVMRDIFDTTKNLSQDERFLLSKKYAKLCQTLANQGFHVVCATISLFHETQAWNRTHITHYIEIFLQVPLTELKRRDTKAIYAKHTAGEISNVVGIDIPAEFPKQPDILIDFNDGLSINETVNQIISLGDSHESSCL